MYVDGNLTPYHQTMSDTVYLHRCWEELKEEACFTSRKAAVEVFNRYPFKLIIMNAIPYSSLHFLLDIFFPRSSRIRKRGIALEAVKCGLGAASAFLAQVGILWMCSLICYSFQWAHSHRELLW